MAIEGVHGSGKTTLVHSAVGHFRAQGVEATDVPEGARGSPFFEAALLYGGPPVDEWAELHLLGEQIATEQARARNNQLIFSDRTVLNVASYWKVRFGERASTADGIFCATRKFLLEYCRIVYDLIFLLSDDYSGPNDQLRETDESFRRAVQLQIEEDLAELVELGSSVVRVPQGMDLIAKLDFISQAIQVRGLSA